MSKREFGTNPRTFPTEAALVRMDREALEAACERINFEEVAQRMRAFAAAVPTINYEMVIQGMEGIFSATTCRSTDEAPGVTLAELLGEIDEAVSVLDRQP